MPFGRKAGNVRAYEFGCLGPIGDDSKNAANAAKEEMWRRNHLWNNLVELHRKYEDPLVEPYITSKDEKEQRKQRKAAFRRQEVRKHIIEQLRTTDSDEIEKARELWLGSGLYWVNYEEVKQAWMKAKWKLGKLNYHYWNREGKISVRWQNGLPTGEAFAGCDTKLRLDPVENAAYEDSSRSVRRKAAQSNVSLRITSDKDGKPIWITLPVVLHRRIPDGLIRSASILLERIGTKERWKLILIVAVPEKESVEASSSIGIDVGWRRLPDGLRVAFWRDDYAHSGSVVLPIEWVNGMEKVEDLRSIRDKKFDANRELLASWLKKQTGLPEWWIAKTKYISKWKSAARLAALVRGWHNNRLPYDLVMLGSLEAWRMADKHLYEYESHLRDQLLRQRRERYRLFAKRLVTEYGKVVVEKFNLSQIAKVKDNGRGSMLAKQARAQRFMACVSSFRLAIKNACKREGVAFVEVGSAYTTKKCGNCGAKEKWENPGEQFHRCGACGVEWDRDENAAENIRRRGSAKAA